MCEGNIKYKKYKKKNGKSTKTVQQAEWEDISNTASEAKRLIKSLLNAGLYHNLPYGFYKRKSINKPCWLFFPIGGI